MKVQKNVLIRFLDDEAFSGFVSLAFDLGLEIGFPLVDFMYVPETTWDELKKKRKRKLSALNISLIKDNSNLRKRKRVTWSKKESRKRLARLLKGKGFLA